MLAKTNIILAQLGLGKPDTKHSIFSPANLQLFYTYNYTLNESLAPSTHASQQVLTAPRLCTKFVHLLPLWPFSYNFSVTHKNLHHTHQKAKQIWRQLCHILKLPFLLPDNATSVIPHTLSSLYIPSLLHSFFTEILPAHNRAQLNPRTLMCPCPTGSATSVAMSCNTLVTREICWLLTEQGSRWSSHHIKAGHWTQAFRETVLQRVEQKNRMNAISPVPLHLRPWSPLPVLKKEICHYNTLVQSSNSGKVFPRSLLFFLIIPPSLLNNSSEVHWQQKNSRKGSILQQ